VRVAISRNDPAAAQQKVPVTSYLLVSQPTITYKADGEVLAVEPVAVNPPSDDRSPWVLVSQWTSRLTSIALEMALPPLGGVWLDRKFGTVPVFMVVGMLVGFAVAMIHLFQMSRSGDGTSHDDSGEPRR